jgi:glycosyl transferase, family 25
MDAGETTVITVISLAHAHDRRATFVKFAAECSLPWGFFDAHTAIGPPLQYTPGAARRAHGRALTDGELGTYASHVAVWQRLVLSGSPQMIVFEDDVVVDWPLISRLASFDFSAIGIDYLRLFTKIPARFRKLRCPFLDRYHHLIRITSFALGTQAYLITREGARRMLEHAAHVTCPIDAYMDKYWRHGVPNIALYPFPVFERFETSTIGEGRFEKQRLPAGDRIPLFFHRLKERMAMARNALGLGSGAVEAALRKRLP